MALGTNLLHIDNDCQLAHGGIEGKAYLPWWMMQPAFPTYNKQYSSIEIVSHHRRARLLTLLMHRFNIEIHLKPQNNGQ